MHGDLTFADIKDRLVENFTAREILNLLTHDALDHLYIEAARLMEWDEDED